MENNNSNSSMSGMQEAANLATGNDKDVSPKLKKQMESYVAALMHSMHNPQTSESVVSMLSSAPPEKAIPKVALQLNEQVEKAFASKSGPVDDSVKIAGAMYLAQDLVELGNVSKAWGDTKIPKEEIPSMMKEIISEYINRGLSDGTIDPIKLQRDTEPLLDERQKGLGTQMQKELGLPDQPTTSMGVDAYTNKKVQPLQRENDKLKTLLQQQKLSQQQQGGTPQ